MAQDFYRRNLPHILSNECPYFITTRLADSLPLVVTKKLQEERTLELRRIPDNDPDITLLRENAQKRYFGKFDRLLDGTSTGPHWLKQADIAKIVCEELHKLEEENRCKLWCYTIMSNHIHLLLTLPKLGSLVDLMRLLKGRSSFKCNRILSRSGKFWQHESYDHVVRNNESGGIIDYIMNNPVKAGLVSRAEAWPYSYMAPELPR